MLTLGEPFLVALGVEITRGVRSVHLVHQIDLTVLLAELVLGVHQNQSVLSRDLASTLVDGPCVSLKLLVILTSDKPLGDDLFLGDVLVVSLGGL